MLLFVLDAEFDEVQRRIRRGRQEGQQRRVDMGAVGVDLRRRGACQKAPRRARVPGTDRVVIGIEQERKRRVEQGVVAVVDLKDELFEEPRSMGAVPFRRTGIRHRLNALILGGQVGDEALGRLAAG